MINLDEVRLKTFGTLANAVHGAVETAQMTVRSMILVSFWDRPLSQVEDHAAASGRRPIGDDDEGDRERIPTLSPSLMLHFPSPRVRQLFTNNS